MHIIKIEILKYNIRPSYVFIIYNIADYGVLGM